HVLGELGYVPQRVVVGLLHHEPEVLVRVGLGELGDAPADHVHGSHGRARIIHDGSSRNRADAKRNGRLEPRGREAYSLQYVDRLSGETARCSGVSADAVEALMDNVSLAL